MAEPFTPVTLLTGFLGAGKTTLLRRLLAAPALADTAVLINEFGEIGLDHHLLERIDARTVLLASGCLCCTVRGELADALGDLHSRRARGVVPDFRRVVIESTGLADPFPVLTTLSAHPVLRHHFHMAGVVTTVDAVNVSRHIAQHPESAKQIAVADRIVLTKTDLVAEAAAAVAQRRIRAINPDAPIAIAADPGFDPAMLLAGDSPHAWLRHDIAAPSESPHAREIRAFSVAFTQALDWTAFGVWLTMLLHRHGEDILRVKGILNVAGSEAPVAIHGVQHLVHPPQHLHAWPDEDRRSRLVFIVRSLPPDAIGRSLAAFTAGESHKGFVSGHSSS